MRVVRALGAVCRDLRMEMNARLNRKPNDYRAVNNAITWSRGADPRTLKGFEDGSSNPTRLDDIVLGYSRATGVAVITIWRMALKKAEEDDPGPEGELLGAIPKPPPKPHGSGGKSGANRNRRATS